jgi:glycosyltransferase involved in cell wall biosynthesis
MKNVSALSAAGLPIALLIPPQMKGLFKKRGALMKTLAGHYHLSGELDLRPLWPVPAGRFRLHRFTHPVAALIYAAFKRFDVIYTRDEITLLLCLLTGRNVLFETYKDIGKAYPPLLGLVARMSKKKHVLGAVLHSRLASDLMARGGVAPEKCYVIHNGFDPGDMMPALDKETARNRCGMDQNAFCISYAGSLSRDKCVERMADMAARMRDMRFLAVGGTAGQVERLKQYADGRGARNMSFAGQKPINEVAPYLYAADVLLIPPARVAVPGSAKTILPIKIFMYLAAGRPIIAPDRPDIREILSHGENALLVEPESLEAYVAAAGRLADDPALCLALSKNAAELSRTLTWEARAEKIIGIIENRRTA